MTKKQVQESYNNYVMNTYKRNDVAIKSGKASRAQGVDGEGYIDFTSGIGVNALGFCDEEWANAIAEQAKLLNHTSNLYYIEPCAQLAEGLSKVTGLGKTFFCNSGAEANEGAIKVARKRSFDKYGKGRGRIITLQNSFHGRTITTLAATGQEVFHNYFFPFTEGFSFAEANNIESMKSLLGDDVCGVLIELVQGEGGVVPLNKDYVQAVKALCREHDLAFMIDEVQTGIGRTGSFFAYEQFDVKPDVVTFAKGIGGGLPLGGFIANEEYSNVLGPSDHGTTFGANPIVCAGAVVVLNRVAKQEFLTEVKHKGEYIKERLLKLPHVKSVSGLGMMIGIELGCKATAAELSQKCHENGLMILTAKAKLRMLPPLTISYAEIDEGLKILEAVLTNAQ
ncbi:acetylornithine/succinylornithine family transaminase [Acetanaerobacterium elongatum]|uniref:Acetylornithine aminotransferase n=1 Tax=Acetanaerobacterium elongatum TaxID=258515 RepID=A0A1H0G0L9_9FIRM|nr:acetylornithine/succinylornithine family transaminase [Acetanaerobacterium elongatum]SDO00445.1 acetylornithine/N-succinyldiaminopimelate aminotransferase [Acetanaerobacterium elongatum]